MADTATLFQALAPLVDREVVEEVGSIYQFDVMDENGDVEFWTLDLQNGDGAIVAAAASECRAGAVIGARFELSDRTLGQLFRGEVDPMASILFGRLRFTGSKRKAAKIQMLFNKIPPSKPTVLAVSQRGLGGLLADLVGVGRVGSYRDGFAGVEHAKYFGRFLDMVPEFLTSQDTNRLTVVFFALSGIDLLGKLDETLDAAAKQTIVDWIYSLQVHKYPDGSDSHGLGFRGGTHLGNPFSCCSPRSDDASMPRADTGAGSDVIVGDGGHLAMSYTGLACLAILGDDLGRVDRAGMARSLRHFQQADGSFTSTVCEGETDMRFLYCACCVAHMLHDWSGIDVAAATQFVIRSFNYDGGIGQMPGLESHGGSTFCGLASLCLMGTLDAALSGETRGKVLHWLASRQIGKGGGFQGRPHKAIDTCYSFWVGSSIHLMGHAGMADATANRAFLMTTQNDRGGGFAKWPNTMSDPLHAYMGISGLSLQREPGLKAVHPALNFSCEAAARIAPAVWPKYIFAVSAVGLMVALHIWRPSHR
eukprot:m.46562 g.46562  ORF g.46562 m.46562 type:complete len:535 (-) comp15453_c0_seq1:59-1663(-)